METQLNSAGGILIELIAALIVAFHAVWACVAMVKHWEADEPRLIIADGVLAALSFSVAGTLLKALALQSWNQIGMFAFVFALRSFLKRVFAHEQNLIASRTMNGSCDKKHSRAA